MILSELLLGNSLISDVLNKEKTTICQTTENFNISMIVTDFLSHEKSLFVVLPNIFTAQKYYDEFINLIDDEAVLFYPADELITTEMLASSGDFKFERINTLQSLLKDGKKLIVTHLNGVIKYQMPKQKWLDSVIFLETGITFDLDLLVKKLLCSGYEHTFTTTKTGQFSRRGSIVDIFPLNHEEPIRLDFFGDVIEKIKIFDVDTQISKHTISRIEIIPVTEMIYSDEEWIASQEKIKHFVSNTKLSSHENEKIKLDCTHLEIRKNLDNLGRYISFFTDKPETIFDFVEEYKTYLIDYEKIKDIYAHIIMDLEEYCRGIGGYSIMRMNYFKDLDYLHQLPNKCIIEGLKNSKNAIGIFAREVINYHGDSNMILADFSKMKDEKTIVCFIKNPHRLDSLKEVLLDNYIHYTIIYNVNQIRLGQINFVINEYAPSFELLDCGLLILNEQVLFERTREQRKVRYKSIYQNSTKISKYDELTIGDYVVHYDHGIGKYLGIKTMDTNGVKRDYIHVAYAKDGALYIPLEQVNLIQKYGSGYANAPTLSTLGSGDWAKAKQRVKKRVHDISEKLIKLYAERQISQGFAFLPDSTDQVLFEADFPYDLTLDQEKAIMDVKEDMESEKPMDRLVCGDVGYGKTEVAMRAAFKAVMSGKQVAILAPTTVLSRQHYYTFKNRMEKFGVDVGLLNRFVSTKNQNDIISKIQRGSMDVVVGTHRILSNEIIFKDLGLLIIDEEQRFGVTHKERIKELKVNVDTLTLSATPIPRTLQMSIIGIKDLSMIETPPKNRYPVQTYVLERNDTVIKEAIEREIARRGQVFYLYNRVDDIDMVASKIAQLVPEAKVCIGHGKMSSQSLENMLCKFIDREYDVLVCTTIIETGIDMPDTNTLIIHDADKMGLSQLYQIRGRVGRSNKIAYAYMMYEPRKILSELAEKRLETIKEFNELGSGFKIAMRDLSIRGSGDLLGEEQSGFIDSVGLEMYLKILEDEIKERKGEFVKEEVIKRDASINEVLVSRYIDNNYINNEDVKIEIHKKIDEIKDLASLKKLESELFDRFGEFSNDLELYMYEKLFKNLCESLSIYRMEEKKVDLVTCYMDSKKSNQMDGNKLFSIANNMKNSIKLGYLRNEILFNFFRKNKNDKTWLINACIYLDTIK